MIIDAGRLRARLLQFFLLAVLSTPTWAGTAHRQYPAFESHVTDAARIMGTQAAVVDRKLKAFEAVTGHQVFVLTVMTTGSRSIDEFAVDVFQRWQIGRKSLDDGVLVVIAVANRTMRIEVGYGLEGVLTDARCSRIIHTVALPALSRGQYADGIAAGVDAVLSMLAPPQTAASTAVTAVRPEAELEVLPKRPLRRPELGSGGLIICGLLLTLLLAIVLGSVWFGGVGLVSIAIPVFSVATFAGPELPGGLIVAGIFAGWFYARWLLIAKNVRQYHLGPGGSRVLTWFWMFFVEQGSTRPLRKGEKARFRIKVSFGVTQSRGGGSGDDTNSAGAGGRSGGGGASGAW